MHFRSDKKNSKNISLFDGISFDKEGNEITILDVLKTEDPDYADEIYKKDNIKLLKKHFKILTPREKDIISKRYGLDGNKETTQKEIADQMKISRSYVSRIEKRAITKMLREFIKNDNNYSQNKGNISNNYWLKTNFMIKLISNWWGGNNMKKVTTKRTKSVNNRPNCLKITKSKQKVNFTTIVDKFGNKIKTSVREARTFKKNSAKEA